MNCRYYHNDQIQGEWCEKYESVRCHNRGGCEYNTEKRYNSTTDKWE